MSAPASQRSKHSSVHNVKAVCRERAATPRAGPGEASGAGMLAAALDIAAWYLRGFAGLHGEVRPTSSRARPPSTFPIEIRIEAVADDLHEADPVAGVIERGADLADRS